VSLSRRKLEVIRWTSAVLCLAAAIALIELQPKGRFAAGWIFVLFLIGLPGAMLTLHLNPPKWFKYLERR
jgi:hypothetical protein